MSDEDSLDVVASLRLNRDPRSAGRARQFIADFCSAANLPADICETAALLTSELVTNAVLHGQTSAAIEVHRPGDALRIAVRDDNPHLRVSRGDHDPPAESGRGLKIVAMLADGWGVEATQDGKAVWFQLRLAKRRE
jgi:anti-sigma regulatory factor (Ser/Thr protein kinase)